MSRAEFSCCARGAKKSQLFNHWWISSGVFSSTFCATTRYLSERGKQDRACFSHLSCFGQVFILCSSQDLSTQIYHSSAYKAALKAAKVPRSPKRRFVMPRLGEWMVGPLALKRTCIRNWVWKGRIVLLNHKNNGSEQRSRGLPANWTDPDASVCSSSFLRLFPPCPEVASSLAHFHKWFVSWRQSRYQCFHVFLAWADLSWEFASLMLMVWTI